MTAIYRQGMIEWDPQRYIYEQIADVIEARIRAGQYPPHFRLSEQMFADEFGTARMTIRRAFRSLRERGLVVTLLGKGSYAVQQPPPAEGGDILD